MVRAILEGRKTQTRRVVRHQPIRCTELPFLLFPQSKNEETEQTGYIWPNAKEQILQLCHYGQPGDRLWVREAWRIGAWDDNGALCIDYRDGPRKEWIEIPEVYDLQSSMYWRLVEQSSDDAAKIYGQQDRYKWEPGQSPCRWRPSINMPRWASRILLEITSVRVERLQDISDRGPANDCTAEGVFHCGIPVPTYEQWHGDGFSSSEKWMYRKLWEQINGAGSWLANPWVWVVEFKRVAT